jgi:Domain of unknown function (DUF3520)
MRTETVEMALTNLGGDFEGASPDLRFAAAVAQFGMILRGDVDAVMINSVVDEAQQTLTSNSSVARAGFVQLVKDARTLSF